MKRFVLPLAVVLVLSAAGAFLLRHAPRERPAAAWLPDNTILLEDMPDIHRTADRWPQTALAQIYNEPEVQAFLAKPLGELPRHDELDKRLAQARAIDPTHFFVAVTDLSGTPKAIAGLAFAGSKEDLDSLLDELRKSAQETWPAGKSDIQNYGTGEIETFTAPGFSAALAYRGKWLFIATDIDLLKATLDRYEGKAGPGSLADLPAYQKCLEHLPDAADNLFFLRPALLSDKLTSLMLMLNPTADTHQMDTIKKFDAVAMALKLDGEVMRDAAYMIKEEPGEDTPLARDSLKISSSDTIIATSGRLQALGEVQMPDPKADPTGVLQLLASDLKIFTDQGLGADQLAQAFGPEMGFVLDWPQGAMIPTPLLMADVRDPAKARRFLDALATVPLAAGVDFSHQDEGGIAYYSLPQTGIGFFQLQATLGLTGKCVIGALNIDAVKQSAKRFDAAGAGLAGTDAYKKAAGLVQEPTVNFSYVDSKSIFERVYGLFRGVASMGFVPHLSDYVDIAKLPAPETISRHLSPMVSSGAVKDGGVLVESAGPVTLTQAGTVTALAAGAAAVPLIEEQMKGQSVSIPGFPGFGSPAGGAGVNPLLPGGYGAPAAPAPATAPGVPAASASPSAGTP
jgi:hypothetical protein